MILNETTDRPGVAMARGRLDSLATIGAYSNSLRVPAIFDDIPAIVYNRSIRQLWLISVPLSPPTRGEAVTGRPLLNLSFALNYAVGGTEPRLPRRQPGGPPCGPRWAFGLLRQTFLRDVAERRGSLFSHDIAAIIGALMVRSPLADRVGDLHRATGRIADGTVLPAGALWAGGAGSLRCAAASGTLLRGLPDGNGHERGHGLGAADGPAL